jgi:antitoxin YqcF
LGKPTDDNKQLARDIVKVFGGQPSVREYFDDERVATIDILTCENAPQTGVNSYSTLALSGFPAFDAEGDKFPFGVEFIAACESSALDFVNALSTCAFNVIKDGMPIYPGIVFPRILELYKGLSSTLSHAFFVDPFLWDDEFRSRQTAIRTIVFLQMVPISDQEYAFIHSNGADALEAEFERQNIDVYDINRSSVFR